MNVHARLTILLLMICLAASGCSFSHSSNSSSDSSSSFCNSSSEEEVSQDKNESYMNEVKIFTDSIVNTNINSDDFMRAISRIAERYGITDWELYKYTYIAIGQGLKHAGIKEKDIDTLKILEQMTGPGSTMKKYILQGYNS